MAVQSARLQKLGAQLADSLGNRVAAFTVLPKEVSQRAKLHARVVGSQRAKEFGFGFVRSLLCQKILKANFANLEY